MRHYVLIVLVIGMCGCYKDSTPKVTVNSNETMLRGKERASAIYKIVEMIEMYYRDKKSKPLSMADIVKVYGENHTYLSSITKKKETIDLTKYSLSFKFEDSGELLYKVKMPDGSIEDIAAQILDN